MQHVTFVFPDDETSGVLAATLAGFLAPSGRSGRRDEPGGRQAERPPKLAWPGQAGLGKTAARRPRGPAQPPVY